MLNEVKSRFLSGKKVLLIVLLFVAVSANAQWVQMSNGMGIDKSVTASMTSGYNIFLGTEQYGVYISTNNGNNWAQTSLNNQTIYSLASSGNNVFAGTATNGIYLTTNNGLNWTQTISNTSIVKALLIVGNTIFAGTVVNGIYRSTNNGVNWTRIQYFTTPPYYAPTISICVSGNNILAGTEGGVLLSTNDGLNWASTSLNLYIIALIASGNNVYASTNNGLYRSTNNGANWTHVSLTSNSINCITISGNTIFIGAVISSENGVYLSTDNGITWIQKNQELPFNPLVYTLLIENNYIFAGTFQNSIWRRSLSEIIGVQNINTEVPSAYSLGQNYPNPFNPTTNIKFSIIKSADVKLIVYDVQGREVQTLENEALKPGTYEASFDGAALNSGVYFYKLITNGYTETKKMLLIK